MILSGDTLVVETTNFGQRAYLFSSGPGPQGGMNAGSRAEEARGAGK